MTYPELAKRLESLAAQINGARQDALAGDSVSSAADALAKAAAKFEKALLAGLKSTSGESARLSALLADPYFATLTFGDLKILAKELLPKALPAKKGEAIPATLKRLAALILEAGTSEPALVLLSAAREAAAVKNKKASAPENLENEILDLGRLPASLRSLELSKLPLAKLRQMAGIAGIKVSPKSARPALEKKLHETAGRIAMHVDWDPVGKK